MLTPASPTVLLIFFSKMLQGILYIAMPSATHTAVAIMRATWEAPAKASSGKRLTTTMMR